MIKIVKADNNQTEMVDICFVVGYTCTNINLALCNCTVLVENKTWGSFQEVNNEKSNMV